MQTKMETREEIVNNQGVKKEMMNLMERNDEDLARITEGAELMWQPPEGEAEETEYKRHLL